MEILNKIIPAQAKKYGCREALTYVNERGEILQRYSYSQLADDVMAAACGLETLGFRPGDVALIFSPNRPEMLITDFACYYNRGIPVSVYSTSSVDQLKYVINDCRPKLVFVGGPTQAIAVEGILASCPSVKGVITYPYDATVSDSHPQPGLKMGDKKLIRLTFADLLELGRKSSQLCRNEVEKRRLSVQPDDTATLIYTSGTTGEPKAADLTHSCFTAAMRIHTVRLTMLSDNDRSLCFLPLSHIFEKAWCYFCVTSGISIAVNVDAREIAGTIKHVQPTVMCSVPRFWEKVYAAVNDKLTSMGAIGKFVSKTALKIGHKRNIDYVRLGKKAPWWLEKMYQLVDKRLFNKIKRVAGIIKGNIFPTAGAPISANIVEFFQSIGVNVMIGYGLSETTATVTCFPEVGYVIGSVGTVMPELEVRIGLENEIQVKGPTVMRGYFNKPQATAEAFTPDGWFRTGDAGFFDSKGALVLTERIKDLFKTSNGKYIAPQAIESRLGEDKFIEQVAVVGESRKYVTAIIIPAFGALKEYARKHKIHFKSLEDLIHNSDIVKMLSERIERLQRGLPSFEQIKKFTLLPNAFTIESGELTNTLKIRRPVINAHYAKEIEAMYA